MKSIVTRIVTMAVVGLTSSCILNADIIVSVSFSDTLSDTSHIIAEGTATVDGFLYFDAIDGARGNDAGATFDAFAYAIETNPSVSFAKPITLANLSTAIQEQGWSIVDQSSALASNQIAGNVNAPSGSGLNVNFDLAALKFTVDTSGLVAGDVVNFNPNLADFTSVSSGSNDFGGNANYVFQSGSLSVVGVPEPGSAGLIAMLTFVGLCRRSRHQIV